MKKILLDSDWLRAVQFKSVTQVQKVLHKCKLYIVTLDYDWLKDNMTFSKPMITRKMMTKLLCGNFGKSFLEWKKKKKMALRVFLVQFGINMQKNSNTEFFNKIKFVFVINLWKTFSLEFICTSKFLKKLKLHSPKRLVQFQLFELKTYSCKLIPNWTRNRMITYL